MRTNITVTLNDFIKIKNFSSEVGKFESDIDLVKGRYIIDAKSIMGIFSLDLSKDIDLNIHTEMFVDAYLDLYESGKIANRIQVYK